MKTKPILLITLIFAALLCWLQAPGHALPAAAPDAVPGEVLVGMRAGRDTSDAVFRVTSAVGGAVRGHHVKLRSYRLKVRNGLAVTDAVAQLQQNPDVLYAEPNIILHADATPSDLYYNQQYGPQRTQTDLAWDQWSPKAQVVIAIVDTGIDYTHPDLTNKIYRDANGNLIGYNATGANAHPGSTTADPIDDHGHGTHCAGISAAEINNGIGIAGIAGWSSQAGGASTTSTRLMPVKVLDSTGNGSTSAVADGVTWAADHGARVISMSLGGGGTTTLANAVQYAWSKGCVVVAAAGNSSSTTMSYPGAYPNVISVAATDSSDTLASYSNYGSWVTVAAPGSSIYSTTPTYTAGGGFSLNYGTLSGTSMATPHVAGEAALLAAQDPTLTNTQIRSLILANVDSYNSYQGRTIATGAGRINVYRAVLAATPVTNPTPPPATSLQINCGGPAYTSSTTGAWLADTNFVGGSTYAVGNAISGTSDPTLYQSERYGSFEYSLPAANGNYTLRLHFAETYYTAAGQRVFNVSVNGSQVLTNFDVVAAGGPNTAVVKSIPVSVSGGSVSITAQGVANIPILSAIQLVPSGSTTPAPPAAPTGLTATGANAQVSLSWTGNADAASYTVKRGTASGGPYTAVASSVTGTSYVDAGLTNGTKYFYVVTATGSGGESGNSNEASATPAATTTSALQINCGGPAYTSPTTGAWQADTSFSGGATYVVSNPISGTSDPTLYQSLRYGSFSYTLQAPNGSYTLTLHFAETYYSAAGQRVFNVLVNGSPALTNFDVVAAGGPNAAVMRSVPVSVTNGTVNITLQAVVNVPILSGIQLVSGGGGTPQNPPAAPAGLTASAGNAQVGLSWTASSGATSYTVKRGTASGGPYTTVGSNVTATTYSDTSVANGTTYYYVVTATGSGGESGNSNEASATPVAGTGTTLRVNCGGPAYTSPTTGAWQADTYFTGGATYAVGSAISGTGDPTLYQSERYDNFSYSLPVTNGTYTLKLHFAETYYTAAGQRVFNVSVNGSQVLTNFDAVAAAGPYTAVVKSFPVSVTNGKINITFQNVVNVPTLSAIEVVPAGP